MLAYQKNYSTETAVLWVFNGWLAKVDVSDEKLVLVLTLLGLSTTFNTRHAILLKRPEVAFHFTLIFNH